MIFFEQLQVIHLLELFAAVAGTYYLKKTNEKGMIRYFVWFLWLTVFVEVTAVYTAVAYYSDYRYFSFVEGTPFAGNYWMYNIYSIIAFVAYILLFTSRLNSKRWRKTLGIVTGLFVLSSLLYLVFSDVYFVAHSVFTFFVGSLVVLVSIGMFYWELLRSDELLYINQSIHFYISVGALVYHLGFVPLVIYSRYFNMESPEFVEIYVLILYGINYFLYSLYILGFAICSKKRKFF